MRTKTIIILSVVMTICSMAGCFAQENAATNRYSMKLTRNDDGTYSLQKKERYAKIINLDAIEDLTVPYTHVNDKLTSKLYKRYPLRQLVRYEKLINSRGSDANRPCI